MKALHRALDSVIDVVGGVLLAAEAKCTATRSDGELPMGVLA